MRLNLDLLYQQDSLTFKDEGHVYHYNGVNVPSVTQVLHEFVETDFGLNRYYVSTINGTAIPADIFEAAGDFGTALHLAAKYHLRHLLGQGPALDWNFLDEGVKTCLEQIIQWIDANQVKVLAVEVPMYSIKMNACGTFDLICEIPSFKGISQVDFKTGYFTLAGPRTKAYEEMFREITRYRGKMNRFVLSLPKPDVDGNTKHKLISLTNKNDLPFFLTRLKGNMLWKAVRKEL